MSCIRNTWRNYRFFFKFVLLSLVFRAGENRNLPMDILKWKIKKTCIDGYLCVLFDHVCWHMIVVSHLIFMYYVSSCRIYSSVCFICFSLWYIKYYESVHMIMLWLVSTRRVLRLRYMPDSMTNAVISTFFVDMIHKRYGHIYK